MKYPYSRLSIERLETCDPRLQKVFFVAADYVDSSILFGHRSNEEQDRLYSVGRSTLRAGQSKHNVMPSLAVDACPYYKGFGRLTGDRAQIEAIAAERKMTYAKAERMVFQQLAEWAGRILQIAESLDIPLRWGGRWSHRFAWEANFHDLFHFEIKE